MNRGSIIVVSIACAISACDGKKSSKDESPRQDSPIIAPSATPTPSPTPTASSNPEPELATPTDSLIICYKVEPFSAAQNCSMKQTELLPEQAAFSVITLKLDYPCKGYKTPLVISTDMSEKLVFNQQPYDVQEIKIYGKGPVTIQPVDSNMLKVQTFQLGCYLKISDISATPTTLP